MTPDLAKLTPLAIRDWARQMIPVLGIEKVAAEVAAVSAKFDEVGAPNPCSSVLVCCELTKHLSPPPGYDKTAIQMWSRCEYKLAKYISEKRRQDHLAVRGLQNADKAAARELARIEGKKAAD
jgi:hypothetical protein